VVTAGVALLSWIYLIQPFVQAGDTSAAGRAVSVAYPVGDLLVLCVLLHLVFSGAVRNRAVALMTSGGVGLLAADSAHSWMQLHGSVRVGGPADLGWAAFLVLWGAAALHPAMRALTDSESDDYRELSDLTLVTLFGATLVGPGLLLWRALFGAGTADTGMIAGVSAVTFSLVMLRMVGLARSQASAARREHLLRDAGERLLAPGSVDEVINTAVAVVRSTVGQPGTACVVVRSDGAAQEVVVAEPAVVDGRLSAAEGLAFLRAGEPAASATNGALATRGGRRWALFPLASVDGNRYDLAVGHPRPLPWATRAIIDAVSLQAGLAVQRIAMDTAQHEQRSASRFRALVQNASDVILIARPDGSLSAETPSVRSVLGYSPEQIACMRIQQLFDPVAGAGPVQALQPMFGGRRLGAIRAEWVVRRADGTPVVMEVSGADLLGDPDVAGVVLTMRDVSDRRRLEAELRHRAFHDGLTNLANRELFNDRLQNALNRSIRQHTSVAVLLLDLDDFKLVNDTFGHSAGDALLSQVGTRLSELLRHGDTAARIGGDEFAVCAEFDDTRPEDVTTLAGRIRAMFDDQFEVVGSAITASATIGIALNTADGADDAAELFREADLALYAAKAAGKHTYHLYEPSLHTAAMHRLEHRTALAHGLSEDQLVVHYQPIVRLDDGSVVGAEALVRWQHPERGLLPPSEFIAVAEEAGTVVALGGQVLDRACQAASRWRALLPGAGQLTVSVNVSARQLHAEGLVEVVEATLRRYGLPPQALVLELTESVLLEQEESVTRQLLHLGELGVGLVLDDFGTGYSSLSYLHRFPLQGMKIDRSFVADMESESGAALVETIVAMAHNLGLYEVAEGIETWNQVGQLKRLGCRFGQGFLFARPMPAPDLEELLAGRPNLLAVTAPAALGR
jgi:diguanylate cyclase (GGDEF)-like protein/PAS domain S-box-containing protein